MVQVKIRSIKYTKHPIHPWPSYISAVIIATAIPFSGLSGNNPTPRPAYLTGMMCEKVNKTVNSMRTGPVSALFSGCTRRI